MVTAFVYCGSFHVPINNSYRRLFDKIPKFEVAVDLRGHLHLVSDQVVKNRTNYFDPLEGTRVKEK